MYFASGINIYPPEKMKYNSNVTLHIKLERVSIRRLSELIDEIIWVGGASVDKDKTNNINFKFKPPSRMIKVESRLKVPKQVDFGKTKKMPGYELRWWYSGTDIMPDGKFLNTRKTENLRRYDQLLKSPSPSPKSKTGRRRTQMRQQEGEQG